jgi:hypothetical protein
LATAARIENALPPMGGEQIPERHLRPLSAIPEIEIASIKFEWWRVDIKTMSI